MLWHRKHTQESSIQRTEHAQSSGWYLESIINITLHTAKWDPLNAGSYIDLPPYLKNKKAIINMKNQDDKCFYGVCYGH